MEGRHVTRFRSRVIIVRRLGLLPQMSEIFLACVFHLKNPSIRAIAVEVSAPINTTPGLEEPARLDHKSECCLGILSAQSDGIADGVSHVSFRAFAIILEKVFV